MFWQQGSWTWYDPAFQDTSRVTLLDRAVPPCGGLGTQWERHSQMGKLRLGEERDDTGHLANKAQGSLNPPGRPPSSPGDSPGGSANSSLSDSFLSLEINVKATEAATG